MRSVGVSPANLGVLISCVPWDSSHLGLFRGRGRLLCVSTVTVHFTVLDRNYRTLLNQICFL